MNTLQLVHKFIIKVYRADALNIAIQDGPESGQSIPHLHTHLIPRYKSDTWGDDLYQKIQDIDLEALYEQFHKRKAAFQKNPINELALPDERRHIRTSQEMDTEAIWLKLELDKFLQEPTA
jgi:bis(5'-adenosyl)-triphosphatase